MHGQTCRSTILILSQPVFALALNMVLQEELEDTKGVIRICKSKERQHNDQKKKTIDKQRSTKQHIKQKISGAPEG